MRIWDWLHHRSPEFYLVTGTLVGAFLFWLLMQGTRSNWNW